VFTNRFYYLYDVRVT